MTKAQQYAQALYELKEPDIKNLRAALERRKHGRLLPQIYREYQNLVLRDDRLAMHTKVTPTKERTRILLELYKKLINV